MFRSYIHSKNKFYLVNSKLKSFRYSKSVFYICSTCTCWDNFPIEKYLRSNSILIILFFSPSLTSLLGIIKFLSIKTKYFINIAIKTTAKSPMKRSLVNAKIINIINMKKYNKSFFYHYFLYINVKQYNQSE